MSESDKQRRYRERNQRAGLVQATVWVPAERLADLHAFVAALRAGRSPRAARRPATDDAQGALDLHDDSPRPR